MQGETYDEFVLKPLRDRLDIAFQPAKSEGQFQASFYALGIHDGKQPAAMKAAQAVTQAIQNRAGINETIDTMDSVALCIELGGVRGQCEQLRGVAADRP
ncbi:hypothetical protein [Pseudochrobactrum asaccharolyticum]|uniref:hypothetical protein n=1 Tax=Pseudochrobactrum asaccharolyticum TaxID=354351 RepID=UPI000DEA98BE|nr:hypothetical protein [Pseudochrobactrum asaccharolyticum]